MQFATVGGITLHYRLEGRQDALALIFVHSIGTDLRIWDSVLPHFADDFKLIRHDLRGHGLSDDSPAPKSMRNHVDDLQGLISYLQIEVAIVIGISLGGLVAMGYAAAYPQHVKALVLCDTATKIGTAAAWNARIETLRQHGIDSMDEVIVARWFSPAYINQHPAEYRGYRNMLTRTSLVGYTASCEAIRDVDMTEAARTITAKTLVLCGTEDVSTSPDQGRALAETLPNASFAVVEGAGHLPCIEQSDQLAGLIKPFCQEQMNA
ncbi:MAG: 3-oxoadipate enol-lactonase [Chloroflexota bacterium]